MTLFERPSSFLEFYGRKEYGYTVQKTGTDTFSDFKIMESITHISVPAYHMYRL